MQYSNINDLIAKSLHEVMNPKEGPQLHWMRTMNEQLGSLRPHELTLVCASTGSGKTALLATIAAQLLETKTPTMVAPVETGDSDFVTRMISAYSKKELNIGKKFSEQYVMDTFAIGASKLMDAPIYITNYDNRVGTDELMAVLEFLVTNQGIKVALLDNLNFFLDVTRAEDQIIEMDRAVHELVMFCKKYPIHIMLIVHPKKTINGRVESEFDIKGSSTAVQECANVMLFNRPKESDVKNGDRTWNDREVVFKKIRKRGMYVNRPFWITYESGRYSEC